MGILQKKMVCGIAFVNKMKYYVYKNILNGRYSKMKVQIEVGKGIQCDGIEIMFGDSISSVVKAVGEVDKYEDNFYFIDTLIRIYMY